MLNKQHEKYASAALMITIGIGVALRSLEYGIGTLRHMGPGYFPLLLGASLMVVGLLIVLVPVAKEGHSLEDDSADSAHPPAPRSTFRRHLRPWTAVVGSMLLFLVLGAYAGLVPATFALVFCAALGDRKNTIRHSLWLALSVVLFAVVIFHFGLRMPFALFPWN